MGKFSNIIFALFFTFSFQVSMAASQTSKDDLSSKKPMIGAYLDQLIGNPSGIYKSSWTTADGKASGVLTYLPGGKISGQSTTRTRSGQGTYTLPGDAFTEGKVCLTWDSGDEECFKLYDLENGEFRQIQDTGQEKYIDIKTVK